MEKGTNAIIATVKYPEKHTTLITVICAWPPGVSEEGRIEKGFIEQENAL